jgi:hypothetical protein
MKYTQFPANTFQKLQMNAGIFCRHFDPATGEITGILGATTGGGQFTASPEFSDFGEDIDNVPKNTMELKRQDDVAVTMSTTLVTIDADAAKLLIGAADIDENDETHIVPRRDLALTDFSDLWWVGDYSHINNGTNAGYCAVHLRNALSTGGFQIQSTDKGKGNFALELTGHYSMENPDLMPYEVYIKQGSSASETPEILLEKHSTNVAVGDTVKLNVVRLIPSSATVTWTSGTTSKATVADGVVTGVAAGSSIITASITVDGASYTDTCTVTVKAAG